MEDFNPTVRKYPRTMSEAFPETVDYHNYLDGQQSIYKQEQQSQADFWLYITFAFATGFLVHLLWGAA